MSIEKLRTKRTEEANVFIDSVLERYNHIDFGIRRDISNMVEYQISEYVVTDNVTNPNYLMNSRIWAIDAFKIMKQLMSDVIDKKATERAGGIVIDEKEFKKHEEYMAVYVPLFEAYNIAYCITKQVGIPKHSVLHIHAREYEAFFSALMYFRNMGKNYYQ